MDEMFKMKVRNFHCLNEFAKKGEIVFTGSSLCEQFPISEMLQNVEPRIRVYNRGIGGDVTEGLMERMEESVFELEPRKVFINIGTNDISRPGYTREKLYANYKKILLQIKERLPETKIYIMSYYPVNREVPWIDAELLKNMFGARTNEELIAVNSGLEAMAKELNCTYINVFDCLLDENGNQCVEYTIDGMHMFANGYKIVLDVLLPYLLEE
ncbi:MAG: lysophospholipase [Clostridia bacterium]|nr:lysophospholipase [Clostridia bacterium]